MTTHESFEVPPSSPTIVGSAVATIVWSSDASSSTNISAPKITRTGCLRATEAGTAASALISGPDLPCS